MVRSLLVSVKLMSAHRRRRPGPAGFGCARTRPRTGGRRRADPARPTTGRWQSHPPPADRLHQRHQGAAAPRAGAPALAAAPQCRKGSRPSVARSGKRALTARPGSAPTRVGDLSVVSTRNTAMRPSSAVNAPSPIACVDPAATAGMEPTAASASKCHINRCQRGP